MRSSGRCLTAALFLCACAPWSHARVREIVIRVVPPADEIRQHIQAGDYQSAAARIDRELARNANDPVLLYQAACVKARLGETDAAARALLDSVKAGFHGFSKMRRDPDLESIRQHPIFRALLDARAAADNMLAQRQFQRWRDRMRSESYVSAEDENLRIRYIAAMDVLTLDDVQQQVKAHCRVVSDALFGERPSQWLLIVLPDARSGADVLGRERTAGVYRHDARELVALDAAAPLRHELTHYLHHSHMDELGQQHPIWIQEGIATLFENYRSHSTSRPDLASVIFGKRFDWALESSIGTRTPKLEFAGGERQAIAMRLRGDDRLIPWREFFAMSDEQFHREPHRTYSQAHSILRFLAAHDVLARWYGRYTADFASDSSGAMALESVFGLPLNQIEQRWRNWLTKQTIE